ncbi:hypothetical protein CBR_g10876 [Chara braunii]|uniref:Uncharacterized protein n=1 Tax=Chara braunii TaxID=69332 RepID=A0A388KPF9_CHABU|nr:hypothetical protein CBR_g10876 [Chara braunii]|eukprot:GBG71939.1 hypothetical protein CBR_g10876 [Chara braunii]
MRPIGVEATPAADGRQIRADEMDIGTTDTRDRTEMDIGTTNTRDRTETDIGTTDTRGWVEMATEVVGMKEEIGTRNDEMGHADGLSAGEMRESNATSRGDGTTEGTDAMSHEGDMTRGTAGMIREGGMSEEDVEETAATIRAVGMREGDMASHQNHIPNGLGDVSMFPSMKENVEARRVKPSKEKEPVRSQSIKITFAGDMATTPIRVAATKSARRSTPKKTDTDYVMTEKDGQRVDGEECSILEYLAASKPARDELQMITRKTHIPLSEEGQGAPKAEASTLAVTGVIARADRMATVILDGMEGVTPDKFYILGSGAVETIINDGAVLDAVIDNGSEAVITDEDLAVQVGLGLDRSYLFEIETADGRKQQIIGVCHKAAIEVQGVRVTLPVFAVKNCSSDLLLGRTWLSHVHAVTIERPDGSQTLSIRKPDGTRVMIETVEPRDPRDPRNKSALAVGARPSDQIKSLPISGRAVQYREKKYGPLLTEEEGRIVEVEDLGSRLIVDDNSYPNEKDEEFGGVVSVSFLKARPPIGGYPSDTSE